MGHAFLGVVPDFELIQFCRKIAYVTRHEAMKAVRAHHKPSGATNVGRGSFVAYRCRICRAWHTGHLGVK